MRSHRQRLLLNVPAPATHLRGVGRIDSHDQTTSTFSLIRQDGTKHRPGSVRDRLGEAVVFDHALDVEFLDGNHAVAVDQPSGGLMNEIMAAVTDTLVDTRNDFAGFLIILILSLTAPTLLLLILHFRQFALCFRQCLFFFAEEARVFNVLAIG